MEEYDIGEAFKAIEDELIASMMRNLERHKAEETERGDKWSMWQSEQLKNLEAYRKTNNEKFSGEFKNINRKIESVVKVARKDGQLSQETAILKAIKSGYGAHKVTRGGTAEFFKVNDRKLNALIKATVNDMKKAEIAILRRANDQYRKIMFNAQVYANTGAGTYEKAVDMATKDFLSTGINCVEYKNGSRHTLAEYADMAIRTASKRAYLQGEGEKRMEWGISTVIMNKRGNPCPKCLPFVGKVMIDDVWSGGSSSDGPYMLMSTAIERGLYHPRCRDSHTTYFPGISKEGQPYTKEEKKEIEKQYNEEQKENYARKQAEKYGRLAEYSLDGENKRIYEVRANEWQKREFKLIEGQQNYQKVERISGSDMTRERGKNVIIAQKLKNTHNDIYLSNKIKIKPKQLHDIDIGVEKCLKSIVNDMTDYEKPTIVIVALEELSTEKVVLASYNAKDNILYINNLMGDADKVIELQKDYAASDNKLSTFYHELLHWKDAQRYIKKYGAIKKQEEYINRIVADSKKELENISKGGYTINSISEYVSKCMNKYRYDEVYTEYRVKKWSENK